MKNVGHGRIAPGSSGTVGTTMTQDLRALLPSAHAAVIDGTFLRAFTATRARTILAGLTPLPAPGHRGLPMVVAGVAGGLSGLCFLGQRASPIGYSMFSIYRDSEVESGRDGSSGQGVKIDELMHEHGRRGKVSACALYDLWVTSNGHVFDECSLDGAGPISPFARLAAVWDCSSHASRTLGSPPPSACSSLLLVGGAGVPRTATGEIRRSIYTLMAAAGLLQERQRTEGPFGCANRGDDGGASSRAEEEERMRWNEELETLLSCSENMAEYAIRPRGDFTNGDDATGSDRGKGAHDDDTAVQNRKDGGGLGAEGSGDEYQDETDIRRADLDFSERLWELAARSVNIEGVRSAISEAFCAVGEGVIFPVVSRDNQTAIGRCIRDGVAMAREARYHDGEAVGTSDSPDKTKATAWRERGSAIIENTHSLAEAFIELGVYKITRDLLFWFETRAGVVATEIERVFHGVTHDKPQLGEKQPVAAHLSSEALRDCRLQQLVTLADTVDLVMLAKSYGAPWRQVRALAHAGIAVLGQTRGSDGESEFSSLSPMPVFPVVLPRPIPARARSKLAHPVSWELLLEPDDAVAGIGAEDTISYVVMSASVFQVKGVDEPLLLSAGAARVAQEALEGCPTQLIPEVLSSVAGVDSFAELMRRQRELRVQKAVTLDGDDGTGVFVCERRFIPWK